MEIHEMKIDDMKSDALITVEGKQTLDDPESEQISLMTQGRFYRRKGCYYISYDETEITGMAGTKTTVRVGPKTVSVIRTGSFPSSLEFEAGQRHRTIYRTNWGNLEFAVRTNSIQAQFDDQGGQLMIDYALEVEHARVSDNQLHITVQSC